MPPVIPDSGARRVAIVTDDAGRLARIASPLIEAILGRGHHVRVFAQRSADGSTAAWLAGRGIDTLPIGVDPETSNPLTDRAVLKLLTKALADYEAHALLALGDRAHLQAARAASRARIARAVLLVDTLADLELKHGDKPGWLSRYSLRTSLAGASSILFSDNQDRRDADLAGIIPPAVATAELPGLGIDLAANPVLPLPPTAPGLTFAMLAALDRRNGIGAYLEAARIVRGEMPSASFVLAGAEGRGPSAFPLRHLEAFQAAVRYIPSPFDFADVLGAAHVVVAPLTYGGVPYELLQGLAAGRPIITTATPGARLAVDERINGCLVPPSDPEALAQAIRSFFAHPELLPFEARASRLKAERRFDVRGVIPQVLAALHLGTASGAT